jgi:hypothetical protein
MQAAQPPELVVELPAFEHTVLFHEGAAALAGPAESVFNTCVQRPAAAGGGLTAVVGSVVVVQDHEMRGETPIDVMMRKVRPLSLSLRCLSA